MENRWRVGIIALAIGFCWLSAVMLRYEAIDLPPKTPPEPAVSLIVGLGWFFLTGLIFLLFGYGLTTHPNVTPSRGVAIASFIALFFYIIVAICVGIGLFGNAGERLLAGLTTIYTGSALSLLAYYTKDPLFHKRWKYIAYLALVGLGIWRILSYFLWYFSP